MRVVFMGSPEFAVPALEALLTGHEVVLVVTQPDKRAGRGKKLTPCAVAAFARENKLPLLQPTSAKKAAFAEALREQKADIGIVVAFGKILPTAVLEAFPHGCLNIHASILPKLRGAAPIQQAILSQFKETGVSIMQLDEGMDTGPVLASQSVVLKGNETAGDLFSSLAPIGAELLKKVMVDITRGTAVATEQQGIEATYAPMLTKEDGRIDWSKPAREVSAQIRGVDPWPGAFTTVGGTRIKVFGAEVQERGGSAGSFQGVSDSAALVACGEGTVKVFEVQAAGKKRMPAATFFTTRQIAVGVELGQSES